MGRGDFFRCILLGCGCWLAGGLASCQKVDLPSEEDAQEQTSGGEKPGADAPGDTSGGGTEFPQESYGQYSVGRILSTYGGVDLESTDYEEMVVGYIVGVCQRTLKNAFFTADEIAASGVASNVLVADSKYETDASRCLPVELKKGTDLRVEANLIDHPELLGQRIGLYGLVKTYFGTVGLKEVVYFEWLPDGGEEEPTPEPDPEEPEEPDNPDEGGDTGQDPAPEERLDTLAMEPDPEPVAGGRVIRMQGK